MRHIRESLNSQKFLFIVALICLFLFFRNTLWSFYDQILVVLIFSKFEKGWLIDIVILLLFTTTVLGTCFAFLRNRRTSDLVFYLLFFVYLLFLACRYFTDRYDFYSFSFWASLKYADYISFAFLCIIILKIKNWSTPHQEPKFFFSAAVGASAVVVSPDQQLKRERWMMRLRQTSSL